MDLARLAGAALVAATSMVASGGAHACEPHPGDAWYVTEMRIDTLGLPSSVEVASHTTSDGEPVLVVTSASDIPIEVAGETLASGAKLVLAGAQLEEAMGITLETRRGDGRPPQAAPPPGRQFLIVVIRQGQRPLVPGAVEYRLNPRYDPQRSAKSVTRCQRRNLVWIAVGVLVLLIVVVALVRSTVKS